MSTLSSHDDLLPPPPIYNQLSEELWKDLKDSNDSFPQTRPLLAHYTSLGTFEQIIANNEMWLSNPLYMNDLEELRFGINEGAAEFRANKEILDACGSNTKTHIDLIRHFDKLFNVFISEGAFNTYVLCFTEHKHDDDDGLLSMWRGYGADGKGIAIVFDTSKVEALSYSPLILSKVQYKSTPERKEWINGKMPIIADFIKQALSDRLFSSDEKSLDKYLFFVALAWLERLISFSLFTKHVGFHEEKEWRIAYLSQRDVENSFGHMLGYMTSQRGIEPKLKLKINSLPDFPRGELSFEKITHRIILGPSISTALAAKSVSRMLTMHGKYQLTDKIRRSSIPYRPL